MSSFILLTTAAQVCSASGSDYTHGPDGVEEGHEGQGRPPDPSSLSIFALALYLRAVFTSSGPPRPWGSPDPSSLSTLTLYYVGCCLHAVGAPPPRGGSPTPS